MSRFVADRDYEYFDLGDESDQERAESSEDEIEIILHGTPEQLRHLRHVHQKEQKQKAARRPRQLLGSGQGSGQSRSQSHQMHDAKDMSSEDEFEREMNTELEKTVDMLEKSRAEIQAEMMTEEGDSPSTTSDTQHTEGSEKKNSNPPAEGKSKTPFYSDLYFDSDDEDNYEGEGDAKVKRQHAQPTDDDLLYDPDMDDQDQQWVDRQRQQHRAGNGTRDGGGNGTKGGGNGTTRGGRKKKQNVGTSDAVLDCPACMTTLCLDCQRHDTYPNQFRAMFVMNCKVNKSELLSVPEQAAKKKFKKSKKSSAKENSGETSAETGCNVDSASNDQFHPVLCEECDTVVGVVDFDEVYHFFNVLTSQP